MTKPVRWHGSVHTVSSLAAKRRRLDRRNLSRTQIRHEAEIVVARMFEGARLCLCYDRRRGSIWRLSVIGTEVLDAVAREVIKHPEIIGCGDALFEGALNQTYRYVET